MFSLWEKSFPRTPYPLEYLALEGVEASCPEGSTLGAQSATEPEEALRACEADSRCDFLSWSGTKKQVTLCHGGQASFYKYPNGGDAMVAVHPRMFETEGYQVLPNWEAICLPGPRLLARIPNVFTLEDAVRRCNANPDCHYFALSNSAGMVGRPSQDAHNLWLCGGEPEFRYMPGWLSGAKMPYMPPKVSANLPASMTRVDLPVREGFAATTRSTAFFQTPQHRGVEAIGGATVDGSVVHLPVPPRVGTANSRAAAAFLGGVDSAIVPLGSGRNVPSTILCLRQQRRLPTSSGTSFWGSLSPRAATTPAAPGTRPFLFSRPRELHPLAAGDRAPGRVVLGAGGAPLEDPVDIANGGSPNERGRDFADQLIGMMHKFSPDSRVEDRHPPGYFDAR